MVATARWALMGGGAVATVVFLVGGFGPGPRPAPAIYLSNLPIAAFFAIAAFLFWRRPDHPVARRMLAAAACAATALALGHILSVLWLTAGPRPSYWVLAAAGEVAEVGGVAAVVGVLVVFPNGLIQRRSERWLFAAAAIQVAVLPALLLVSRPTMTYDPYMAWAHPVVPSPLFLPALDRLGAPAAAWYEAIFVWTLPGVALLGLRYRRLPAELRFQMRWPLAAAMCFAGLVAFQIVLPMPDWLPQLLWDLTLPLIPLSIAIALLRHRLLDIDLVIRRSLVYGVLWLAIALAYVGVAAGLGLAAGRRLPVELAILLTIAATVVFQPLRRRLERLADRLVFGERTSGEQLLEVMRMQSRELADSRARLVRAQEEERRRIERDLHDGVQQRLVSLAVALRRAARLPAQDLRGAVGELAGEAEDTVFALRELSRGIHPSVLSDAGLAAALWSHAQRLPVNVAVDVAPDVAGQRFGADPEAALYFVALEAILNAQKHAAAERVRVCLRRDGADLRLEVADDGPGLGGAGSGGGSGLRNMRDRVAAVGGSLSVTSGPGGGTVVVAAVPASRGATPAGRSAPPPLAG